MNFVLNELWKKEYYKYLKRRQHFQMQSFYEIARFFDKCEKTIQIHEELFDLSRVFWIEPPLTVQKNDIEMKKNM